MRGILLYAMAVGTILSPVHASNSSNQNSGGEDARLELNIEGHISPKCEIDLPNQQIRRVLTDGPGREALSFRVNCNQMLSVTMTSANGGLEHPTRKHEQAFEGFTNFLPYTAAFSLNANGAQPIVAESAAMVAGTGGSIGAIPFNASGTLELNWTPAMPLLGGTYEDIIEIRVSGAGEQEIPRP
jgi:hypothetical protein